MAKFEQSQNLKSRFNLELERWRERRGQSLERLARRCGVSPSYLSHISRYGRVPSKPVLLLLALNFEMDHPEELLYAAGLNDDWPYEPRIGLRKPGDDEQGFLTLRLDMDGFTNAIRDIVRSEVKHRSISDLTRGRPLRIGLNKNDNWVYLAPKTSENKNSGFIGPFKNLFEMLSLTLQCKLDPIAMHFVDYPKALEDGEIDCFGPVASGPPSPPGLFTFPFCYVGVSALARMRENEHLENMPLPRTVQDISSKNYVIAVVKNSPAHLFAQTRLGRKDSEMIICDTFEEAVERLTMCSISKAAHLLLCNSMNAMEQKQKHPHNLELLFHTKDSILLEQNSSLAVRPDWPELAETINSALRYLNKTGSLSDSFERWQKENGEALIRIPSFRETKH